MAICSLVLAAAPASASVSPGVTYTGDGTFYDATGRGNCSYDATSDTAIAALNHDDYGDSAMCGAYLHATGPLGSTTVKIVDRCPECAPGDIDFSAAAFARIANVSAGRVRITWKLVSPDITGPVSYRYKEGSSRWWCGIQVRNHRNPVAKLEVLVGSNWLSLPRYQYNYFVSETGSGCGSTIRITDSYGQVLVDSGIAITDRVDQPGRAQFTKR